ncbi:MULTISPECIES: macrolide 2'-phosphotransferase [Nocardia]|uniref:macrolide 2'-phosphotransferase n=1 Tax=Nocardia TaxID=1817 RepID=UPI0015741858|nr:MULTISPECIES: macrolide 2'-phosphotransferase [Nocardia]
MDDFTDSVNVILSISASKGLALRPETVVVDDNGWDFRVIHATDADGVAWVLRAPRRAETVRAIAREGRILEILQGRFDVAIPRWRFGDDDLIAYPRLPGEPVAWEDPKTYELQWRFDRRDPPKHYIDALGKFMAALHSTPLADAEAAGIPVRSSAAARADLADQLAFAATELDMHTTWRERGARWLERDDLWPESMALIHGDLHPGHELVDADNVLLGIIDWTDAEISYVAKEFVEAARKFEPPVLDELFDAYERHGGEAGPGPRTHAAEAIAFAPLALAVLGLESGKTRYVDAARLYFRAPSNP